MRKGTMLALAALALVGCSTDRELNVDADGAFVGDIEGRTFSGAGSMDYTIGQDECATVSNVGTGYVRIYITTRKSGFPAATNQWSDHIEVPSGESREVCGNAALHH